MSSFGEIVEPGTRTAWEDWDENLQEHIHPLAWQKDVEVPDEIRTFYVLEGKHIADNINALSKFKLDTLELVNAIPAVNLNLYRKGSDAYVCVLRDYNLLLASEIIELLKDYVTRSKDVIAILTKPLVEHQSPEYTGQTCIMRSITTTKLVQMPLNIMTPKLEQPNIISGVAAGVIYLREILNQSGAAIICYMEHNEEYVINELKELLAQLHFGPVQSKPNHILNSNLYI